MKSRAQNSVRLCMLIVTRCSEMCAILVDLIAVTERFGCIEITKLCQIVIIVTCCSEMCTILVDLQ